MLFKLIIVTIESWLSQLRTTVLLGPKFGLYLVKAQKDWIARLYKAENRAQIFFLNFSSAVGDMHYFMILSILKNGSSSHRNMGLREHWHYLVGAERRHISRILHPPKVFCSSTSPPYFIFAENQGGKWFLLDPYAVDKGNNRSPASLKPSIRYWMPTAMFLTWPELALMSDATWKW